MPLSVYTNDLTAGDIVVAAVAEVWTLYLCQFIPMT